MDITLGKRIIQITFKLYKISKMKEWILRMDTLNAVEIAEGVIEDITKEEYLQAWQHLVDTGTAWSLQGWFGRTAMQLIEQGVINEQGN